MVSRARKPSAFTSSSGDGFTRTTRSSANWPSSSVLYVALKLPVCDSPERDTEAPGTGWPVSPDRNDTTVPLDMEGTFTLGSGVGLVGGESGPPQLTLTKDMTTSQCLEQTQRFTTISQQLRGASIPQRPSSGS